jgi:hypothetical protein
MDQDQQKKSETLRKAEYRAKLKAIQEGTY